MNLKKGREFEYNRMEIRHIRYQLQPLLASMKYLVPGYITEKADEYRGCP